MPSTNPQYYQHIRHDLINEVSTGEHRILEVGCAYGDTGALLKQNGQAKIVVGIELNTDAANIARSKLDHVIAGDLESLDLNQGALDSDQFDYIICGDILEHLKEPLEHLQRLVKLLKIGGKIIISLPNIRHYSVLFPLIFKDEWTYREAGILDSTHLRFFTASTGMQLIKNAGLVEIRYRPAINRRRDKFLNTLSFGLLTRLIASQSIYTAIKIQ
jgi:2-polyprenyl-3-methyl-5-hydroxy-6-metoxy-1,4-benzoquinol methylase